MSILLNEVDKERGQSKEERENVNQLEASSVRPYEV
jgi:hypothetical protein